MKKMLILFTTIILIMTLTSCENPKYSSQVTFNQPTNMGLLRYEETIPYSIYGRWQPEGFYTNDVLTYKDQEIDFKILHIYKENSSDPSRISSYGISIQSDVDLRIDVYSGLKMIFSIDFQPNGTFEYKQTIPNNLFVGVNENDEVTVKISPLDSNIMGDEFYQDTFTYTDNYEPTDLELENYQPYQNLYYPLATPIIISILFIVGYVVMVVVYRLYYKKEINELLEQEKKTKFLLSPYIVAIGLFFIIGISGILTNEIAKTKYHENHFSNIYVSATTTGIIDLDWENITLSKLDVRVNGEDMATYMNVTDRIEITTFLEYSRIKENVDNILEYKKDEPFCTGEDFYCVMIGFWAEIELYLTDGSTTFKLSIREYDEYTYYCALDHGSGTGLLYFTIDEEDPYFSDIQNIHNVIEDALDDYMKSVD
jgi:hypothetical protein